MGGLVVVIIDPAWSCNARIYCDTAGNQILSHRERAWALGATLGAPPSTGGKLDRIARDGLRRDRRMSQGSMCVAFLLWLPRGGRSRCYYFRLSAL